MEIRLIHAPADSPYREAIADLRRAGYYQGQPNIDVWDKYDAHSSHILAFDGDELVGKVRVTASGPYPVSYWSNGQADVQEEGLKMADFSRAVVHPRLRGLGMYGLMTLHTILCLQQYNIKLIRALVEAGLPALKSLERIGLGLRLLPEPNLMPPDKKVWGYLATANPSERHWQELYDANVSRLAGKGIVIRSEV